MGTFIGGGTPSTENKEYWSGNIPWVSSSDIKDSNVHHINYNNFITNEAIQNSATKLVSKNSILFVSRVGIGKLAVTKNQITTSQDFTNLKLNENHDSYYVAYLFSSKMNIFKSISQVTSIKGYTTKDFKSVTVNVPKLEEQKKIASFLSSVDEKISQLEKKKTLLETYKRGIMQKIFSQELRFKDENGGEFAEWKNSTLGEECEINGGGTPDSTNKNYWGDEIYWFTPTEIKVKYLKKSKRMITRDGLNKSSAKLLPKGSLLLTTRATIGDVSFCTNECSTNQGFQSFLPTSKPNLDFLYYWIKCNKKELIKRSSGSTFLEISKKEIQKITINLPNINEQQKIASFLSSIDNKIEIMSTQLEKTREFKKGLLQQMFV